MVNAIKVKINLRYYIIISVGKICVARSEKKQQTVQRIKVHWSQGFYLQCFNAKCTAMLTLAVCM